MDMVPTLLPADDKRKRFRQLGRGAQRSLSEHSNVPLSRSWTDGDYGPRLSPRIVHSERHESLSRALTQLSTSAKSLVQEIDDDDIEPPPVIVKESSIQWNQQHYDVLIDIIDAAFDRNSESHQLALNEIQRMSRAQSRRWILTIFGGLLFQVVAGILAYFVLNR